ncbi:hypothetical protein SlsnVgp111 [Spodoptera littoralis nucleopolyhedrovirus]|uniref:Uncharacterized protein n=1 Tax=Spodoptera littoralis nuclear polyhedrosis virus TaxID=10456 RepID=M1K3Z3_NPVSL|nr:hypothetical protein SlsnVgp111 [Spodoptera littoralis nucleopolyhedrovirus]AGE89966.1 hypothetical protein SlsnVgp111 [Spodoptera littoralis nucleopolyhedrovirus]
MSPAISYFRRLISYENFLYPNMNNYRNELNRIRMDHDRIKSDVQTMRSNLYEVCRYATAASSSPINVGGAELCNRIKDNTFSTERHYNAIVGDKNEGGVAVITTTTKTGGNLPQIFNANNINNNNRRNRENAIRGDVGTC